MIMANSAAPAMSANIIHCASREAFASGVLRRRWRQDCALRRIKHRISFAHADILPDPE